MFSENTGLLRARELGARREARDEVLVQRAQEQSRVLAHEDRALVNAVRRLTRDYARRRDVVVHGSSRRVQAWGLAKTLLWYKDHAYRPEHVDIR